MSQQLYEHDFPDWFIVHARSYFGFRWPDILMALRNESFFFPDTGYFGLPTDNILGRYLDKVEARQTGEELIQRLAALATNAAQWGFSR